MQNSYTALRNKHKPLLYAGDPLWLLQFPLSGRTCVSTNTEHVSFRKQNHKSPATMTAHNPRLDCCEVSITGRRAGYCQSSWQERRVTGGSKAWRTSTHSRVVGTRKALATLDAGAMFIKNNYVASLVLEKQYCNSMLIIPYDIAKIVIRCIWKHTKRQGTQNSSMHDRKENNRIPVYYNYCLLSACALYLREWDKTFSLSGFELQLQHLLSPFHSFYSSTVTVRYHLFLLTSKRTKGKLSKQSHCNNNKTTHEVLTGLMENKLNI